MKIGILTFATDYSVDIAVLARRAEELGFDSLWLPEHPIMPADIKTRYPASPDGLIPKVNYDLVDPLVALARASAATTKLKLGTGVCLAAERNPLLLAKQVATLDMYSGGRFLFGVGAGWLREEMEIMGTDFDHRWTQVREAVMAMKELWTKTKSEFHGRYYDFPSLYSFPRPVQRPHPPVLLGSVAKNVFKRVVAWGDGWAPSRVTPEEVKRGRGTLDELAEEAGRDPASLEITVFGQPLNSELIKRFEEVGANRVIMRVVTATEDEALRHLEKIAQTVFP